MNDNYRIETPKSRVLSAIHAARRDLLVSEEMIRAILSQEDPPDDDPLEEAAWTTAAIRYARAWKLPGYPNAIREEIIASLNEVQRDIHTHVLTIRDAMYAHQLGVGTDYTVTANVGSDSLGNLRLWGVGIQSHRISSPGLDAASDFLQLLEVSIRIFLGHEQQAHLAAFEELQALGPSEWTRLGPYEKNLNYDLHSSTYRLQHKKRNPQPK